MIILDARKLAEKLMRARYSSLFGSEGPQRAPQGVIWTDGVKVPDRDPIHCVDHARTGIHAPVLTGMAGVRATPIRASPRASDAALRAGAMRLDVAAHQPGAFFELAPRVAERVPYRDKRIFITL